MTARRSLAAVVAGVALAAACSSRSDPPVPGSSPAPRAVPVGELSEDARDWVDSTLASLEGDALAAQLVIPWIPGSYASPSSPAFAELEDWVERGIGGVSISIGLPHSYADKLNQLQERARIPLLVTSDFENGGPGMRINHTYALPSLLPQGGGTSFPPTMAFGAIGDPDAAFHYGRVTALEARAVGVHVVFAPVLDVNSNPRNPVINTRSFGEDPDEVTRLGMAFIRGIRAGGAYSTAKHFPGHGDTDVDSHIGLPTISADRDRLDSVELVPFQAAVDAGVDAVMTAHVAMPVLLGEGALPATLEPRLMTRLLREEMGFQGLLFTDALRMGAITAAYGAGEAAVMALEAGSDVLLAPDDIPGAIDAVVAAVETGRLDRQRLKASARKVLTLKAGAGLHRRRTVDLDRVSTRVGTGDHRALADEMAERSITLPRDDGGHVPLDLERAQRVLSVTWARPDDLLASATFDPMLARFVDRVARVRLRPDTDPATYRALSRTAAEYDAVVVSAYVPPRSGAGAVAIPDDFTNFVGRVADTTPTVLISFGSPYVLTAFPELGSYMIAWGDREVSQRAAARALVGASGVGGRLPVSIPPYHVLGDGLDRTARDVQPRPAGDPLVEAGMVAAPAGGAEEGGELRCVSWTGSPVTPDTDPSSCPRASLVFESGREAPASEVGMDEEALSAVDNLILRGITQGATPGAVLAVGRHGRFARLRGYGRVAWDEGAAPTNHRSVYDLASLTKVVATTTAMMILVDEGRIDLDERVVTVLPWWDAGDPAKARVTVRQLLLHRAGLPPFRRYYLDIEGIDSYKEAIAREPLIYEPGDSTVYSDIGLMTAGFIIEEVTGQGLDEFVEERVWGPLGMDDTGFTPERSMLPRIPPTEVDATYRQIHVHGVVHDENAYAMGGVAGHAGLFSSAADLAVFAQTLLNGGLPASCPSEGSRSRVCASGASGGQRLIREATVTGFTTRRDDSSGRAHGWDTPWGPSSAGDYFTERSFGHTGYTGTSLWIDPVRDVFVVLLTTRVNPTRANTLHVALRRAVHDGIARAITDMPVERR